MRWAFPRAMARTLFVVAGCAALAGLASPGRADAAAADAVPLAPEVVLRGKKDLGEALIAAARGRDDRTAAPGAVLLVVDPTPYVRAAADDVVEAVFAAGRALPGIRTWRVARLGEDSAGPFAQCGDAAAQAVRALRPAEPVRNTFEALRRSVESFAERDGHVVYLADWQFEDDQGAEAFIDLLRMRGQSLSVVGSEAAFSRAWNDGLDPRSVVVRDRGGDPDIGRSPFGRARREAPWHGGATAWPAHPGYWSGQPWLSEFLPRTPPPRIEDLRERLGGDVPPPDVSRPHPLPSAFGPWGLMRTCGRTGGRYVLWSWNPFGRSDVSYDFARCDLLAPDLRSRADVLADVQRRPLPRAIVAAWNAVGGGRVRLAGVSSPLSESFDAQEMTHLFPDVSTGFAWSSMAELRAYLRAAPGSLRAIDETEADLTRAIDRVPASPDSVDLRYLAEAHLLRHVLRVQRFSLGAALETAKAIPEDWFRRDGSWVALRVVVWTPAAGEDAAPGETSDRPHEEDLERLVADDRAALLRRYGGTPIGETVARNRVYVWEAVVVEPGKADDPPSRSPAQSGGPKGPPTPGGSAGSGGPSTGK